jgi:hypothetical protein
MGPRLRTGGEPVIGFGARLQAAEQLIRLGARAVVVTEALDIDGMARSLVRRMYVGIRGPGRPRGPLPCDPVELLATAAARMEASIFLDAWQRLREAGTTRAQALVGAWQCLAGVSPRARTSGRRFGIDQCWVLARALERGALQRSCCDRCGVAYFDARRPGALAGGAPDGSSAPARPSHLRCPHCAIRLRPAGAGSRSPAVSGDPRRTVPAGAAMVRRRTPGGGPAAAQVPCGQVPVVAGSHPLSDLAQRYSWAEALFREGARPPIVTHVTGLAMTGTLRQLFVEVAGHGPRQGALPQLGEHIIATYARKLESSVVVVTADRLVRAGHAPAATLLATWRTYRALFGDSAHFDINAVALVLRARHHPDFTLVDCRQCGSAYLELRLDVPGSRCPVCRALEQARARATWT